MADILGRMATSIAATGFLFAASARMFGVMQQSGYKNARFFAWLRRRDNLWYNRLSLLFLLLLLSCALTALCFSFLGAGYARLLSLLPFALFLLLFCCSEEKSPLKVPVKKTGRTVRLGAIYALLLAVFCYLLTAIYAFCGELWQNEIFLAFSILPLCAVPLCAPFVFMLANAVSCAFENPKNARFVKKAGEKLRASSAIKIGVTGSYGKTSVKNILVAVLSEKYRVVATPESYNTPVGIAKTTFLPSFDDAEVIIAEMGAAKKGDIEELCDMVDPDYGVITGVCRQHSASFGGIDEIFNEKKILASRAKKTICGTALYDEFGDRFCADELKKVVFVPHGAVKNIGGAPFETTFDLCLDTADGEIVRNVCLPLLGKGAADNVAIAAILALQLGMSADEIFRGIEKITPVPHRLQLLRENGVYILDDGYNASEKSAEQALEALAAFPKKKYVVTPGIVETGLEDTAVNRPLGEKLARFDGVFVHVSATAVKEGYFLADGDEQSFFSYSSVDEVKEKLSALLGEGDAVLFLNDLPDVY